MRFIAALVLSILLVTLFYAGFWWASLSYNAHQMRGAVEGALGGTLEYGQAQWIPDLMTVRVRWPDARIVFHKGPVREVRADHIVMVSGFLSRDRWRLVLPPVIKLKMEGGHIVTLQTNRAELAWLEEASRLMFKADEVDIVDERRVSLVKLSDVVVERRPDDAGVRVNLASRPVIGGVPSVLSGNVVISEPVLNALLDYFGKTEQPSAKRMAVILLQQLQQRGEGISLENVSFRNEHISAGAFGVIKLTRGGLFAGNFSLMADHTDRIVAWVKAAGIAQERTVAESLGWRDFQRGMSRGKPTLRVETIPDGILLNGYMVGPAPRAVDVLDRLWK